jgi:hypothetical protein
VTPLQGRSHATAAQARWRCKNFNVEKIFDGRDNGRSLAEVHAGMALREVSFRRQAL